MWRGRPPEASIETRLAVLEANIGTLRTEQAEIEKQLNEETRNRTEAIGSERLARESAVREIRTQLETFGAGSLHLEMAGLFWLVLGVVLTTASGEVAGALKWLR